MLLQPLDRENQAQDLAAIAECRNKIGVEELTHNLLRPHYSSEIEGVEQGHG